MRDRGPKPKKEKGPARVTYLKMRVRVLTRMPKSVLFRKIRESARHGVIDPEISLSVMHFDHAKGKRYQPGQVLSARDRDELINAYNLLTQFGKHDVRFEVL